MAVQLTESQVRQAVPIHGVSLELFGAQVGSIDLAKRMRLAGWIVPVCHKPLLFDTGDVAACWVRIRNGEVPDVTSKSGASA